MNARSALVMAAVASLSLFACSSSEPAARAGPPTEGGLPSGTGSAAQTTLPPAHGQLPPPAAPHLVAYLDGLDALMQGRFPEAVNAFTQTLSAQGDDPTFVLARGVASTLAESYGPAITDLARARRLGIRGREAELWTYAAEAMSGQVTPEHAGPSGPRSLGGGVPPSSAFPATSCRAATTTRAPTARSSPTNWAWHFKICGCRQTWADKARPKHSKAPKRRRRS